MKDPYLIEHQAYLNSLESMTSPTRSRPLGGREGSGSGAKLKAMAVIGVIAAALAFAPWDMLVI